ncbi:MAG: hypothetical protein U5L74_00830, partial [Ideonella sp.]|nr:hypothetical protein [Ideonella sp.]
MDHFPASPVGHAAAQERAPLTRARTRTRHASAAPLGCTPAAAALPNVDDWSDLFKGQPVSAAEAATLNRVAQVSTVAQGRVVFSRQGVTHSLFWVNQGDVALGVLQAEGSFRIEQHLHGPAHVHPNEAL